MHPKDAAGIANSVDLDQSDLGLHCLPGPVCPKTEEHYGRSFHKNFLHSDEGDFKFLVKSAIF